jgi:tetratricopeptide (TPR) repeat protein
MIELLLGAERALAAGLVDQAERLYRQAADGDPRNSIAVVGLARVALERGDEPEAWRQARRALAIDPENVAAQRLAGRLEEIWAYRGESLPEVAGAAGTEPGSEATAPGDPAVPADPADPADPEVPALRPETAPESPRRRAVAPGENRDATSPPPRAPTASPRSLVDRLFRRKRR